VVPGLEHRLRNIHGLHVRVVRDLAIRHLDASRTGYTAACVVGIEDSRLQKEGLHLAWRQLAATDFRSLTCECQ